MRYTFSQLQTKVLQYTQNIGNVDATLTAFVKDEINKATRFIYAELQDFMTSRTQTFTTVANQQYYHYPPDMMNIESVVVTIGSVKYTLRPLESQFEWDRQNAITFQGTAVPMFYFARQSDFGIWPIPQGAYTGTMNYTYRLKDMAADDYSTGTVTVTNASQTITGSGTTFTAGMVGRWFITTNDQYDYKLSAFTSTTNLTIDNYFQGTTAAGQAYLIGESPDIPQELQEIIPYQAAANYFLGMRKDDDQATYYSNMFWTGDPRNDSRDMSEAHGGLLGAKKRYSRRQNSRIIRRTKKYDAFSERLWASQISDSS